MYGIKSFQLRIPLSLLISLSEISDLILLSVLTYEQQSKELANIEQDKRIQEYRTLAELENIRASRNYF
ncbi:hypothetical protein CR513_08464, partial [Mucuna pruriens]